MTFDSHKVIFDVAGCLMALWGFYVVGWRKPFWLKVVWSLVCALLGTGIPQTALASLFAKLWESLRAR